MLFRTQMSYKRFGFPVPYCVTGRWGCTPFPSHILPCPHCDVVQMSYKRFGFPVPYCVTGRWGCTPFPSRVPLLYVLGEPIEPPSSTRVPSVRSFTSPASSSTVTGDAGSQTGVSAAASGGGKAAAAGGGESDDAAAAFEADLDEFHGRFYAAIEALYYKYRHLHPDFREAGLRIITQH